MMNRKELKKRFDDIPQDFDQAALWNRINRPKKKRRILFWIFLGFIGISFIAIVSTFFIFDKNENTIISENEVRIEKEYNLLDQTKVSSSQKDVVGSYLGDVKSKAKEFNDINEVQLSKKKDPNEMDIVEKNRFLGKPIIDEEKTKKKSAKRQYTKLKKEENGKLITENIFTNKEIDAVLFNVNKHLIQADVNTPEFGNKSNNLLKLEFLPLKKYSLQIIRKKIFYNQKIFSDTKQIFNNTQKRNFISLFVGIGHDNHHFSNTELGKVRGFYEAGLETRSFGMAYSRDISTFYFVKAKVGFTMSQTKFQRTEKLYLLQYVLDENPIKSWTSITYNLYNEYYRIDADIVIGYLWKLDYNWRIKPALGFGYNINSYQRGEIWSNGLRFIDLKLQKEYKRNNGFFGLLSLDIEKSWNDYSIGVSIEAQSKRSLVSQGNYDHHISPILSSIYFGKKF